ncbi:MAG: hypothetical protein Q8P20_05275 [bacterium]|nr:hypothetical protein [bacterium]
MLEYESGGMCSICGPGHIDETCPKNEQTDGGVKEVKINIRGIDELRKISPEAADAADAAEEDLNISLSNGGSFSVIDGVVGWIPENEGELTRAFDSSKNKWIDSNHPDYKKLLNNK